MPFFGICSEKNIYFRSKVTHQNSMTFQSHGEARKQLLMMFFILVFLILMYRLLPNRPLKRHLENIWKFRWVLDVTDRSALRKTCKRISWRNSMSLTALSPPPENQDTHPHSKQRFPAESPKCYYFVQSVLLLASSYPVEMSVSASWCNFTCNWCINSQLGISAGFQ